MAMVIDYSNFLMDFCSYTASTTTSPENDCKWNDWSPVVDWDTLSVQQNEFNDLTESMVETDDTYYSPLFVHSDHENSISTTETTATHNRQQDDDNQIIEIEEEGCTVNEDSKGLRLIHLLMAAAEALSGVKKRVELARVILLRLKELVSPTEGSNMERLAAHFTQALQSLLEPSTPPHNHPRPHLLDDHSDVLPAFQLLQDISPYVKFGHFTANQAILESVTHDRRIHIVDYDIMEGIQWASLMQSLVSRKDGPPTPHLRITAVTRGASTGRRTISTVQETGRRLTAFAASIGQPFSFHQCRLDSEESFRPNSLKLVRGEALVFNCMLHLPHFSFRANGSVSSFLSGAKSLNPRLITLVEEEVGPIGNGGFIERFMDTLHHYSAIYDSLEAGFPMQSRARALVERVFMGPRIIGSVDRIYRARADVECGSWGSWLRNVGFKGVNVSFANHCQAKLLLGLYNDGYRVEEIGGNRLALGWKSRRILSASIWTSPPHNECTID